MRSTSYTATSITEVPAFMYHHDCNSEHLNGRHTEDSELVALKSGEAYAWGGRVERWKQMKRSNTAAEMYSKNYSVIKSQRLVCSAQNDNTGLETESLD